MPQHKIRNFEDEPIPQQTIDFNAKIIEAVSSAPDIWDMDQNDVRNARREGKGIFPLEPFDPDAKEILIEGKGGKIPLRLIRPDSGTSCGTFLHIHGGGWMYGNADLQDQRLKELANLTGLDFLSVEYRLTPEHPYPAGPDDCESAALWLATEAGEQLNTKFLAIGGESAGGHLSANALLRLRDKHGITPFHAAVLIAGCFDLGMTPSAANFNSNLILRRKDMVNFSDSFLSKNEDRRDPDISPLYAELKDMPPAHFSIGTHDALLDDSVFMANRWKQVQDDTELDIYPGGCHVFQYFPHLEQSKQSRDAIVSFLTRLIEARS